MIGNGLDIVVRLRNVSTPAVKSDYLRVYSCAPQYLIIQIEEKKHIVLSV
jgi:hypothetical protein